jgi:hypothetical protein
MFSVVPRHLRYVNFLSAQSDETETSPYGSGQAATMLAILTLFLFASLERRSKVDFSSQSVLCWLGGQAETIEMKWIFLTISTW